MSMTARLTEERAQAVLTCPSSFRGRNLVPLKQFQRLLGYMESAATVTPLGLLHMRPLQHWLHSRVPRWAWRHGTLRVGITQQCHRYLSPWTDLAFLRAGVPLGKHVLVHTDNTEAVSYINWLGGIRSHRMSQLARHLLLWSPTQFKSLHAVHITGKLKRAADALSRQLSFPGEWRLHPETIRLIWSRFGEAQVDLFASPESSHCQLYFSLTEGPLGTDALAQTLCKLKEDEEQVLLVAPHWPTRTWFPHFPRDSTSLAHSSEEGTPLSGAQHHMAPASRSMKPPCVAPGQDAADLSGLPPVVLQQGKPMEFVRDLVFFSPRRPPKMHDWSSAFLPARKVGA